MEPPAHKLEYAAPGGPLGRLSVSQSAGDVVMTVKPRGPEAVRGLVRAGVFCSAAVSFNCFLAAGAGALSLIDGFQAHSAGAPTWALVLLLLTCGLATGFLCLVVFENVAAVTVRLGFEGVLSRTLDGLGGSHRTVWHREHIAGVSADDGRIRLRLRDGRVVPLFPRFGTDEQEDLNEVLAIFEAWRAEKR